MSGGLQRETRIPGVGQEAAVAFQVQGETLHGILARPDGQAKPLGVVFVHGWSGNRAGPHGLLTGMARHFATQGYASLRFDFRGRGESEGDGLSASLPTMAEDLIAGTRCFCETAGVEKVVYFGLCSGGNVTIGTLPKLPAAAGLVLLSVYPFSDGDAFGRDVHRTFHYLRVYWRKATQGSTWRRLFRGDVSLKGVFNVLFGHFLNRGRNRQKEEASEPDNVATSQRAAGKTAKSTATESRTQGGEAPKKHLAKLRADLPAMMVYGTADPDAPAAQRYFGDYVQEKALPVEMVEIEGANHNFSSAEWKARVGELADAFLARLA
jgi:pimeloyl-ACP methyl ester carboxylesterase